MSARDHCGACIQIPFIIVLMNARVLTLSFELYNAQEYAKRHGSFQPNRLDKNGKTIVDLSPGTTTEIVYEDICCLLVKKVLVGKHYML